MTIYEATNTLVWQVGPPLLVERGMQERAARSCLGMWLKNGGAFKVLGALSALEQNGSFDPVTYMSKATRPKGEMPTDSPFGKARADAAANAYHLNDLAEWRAILKAETFEGLLSVMTDERDRRTVKIMQQRAGGGEEVAG